MSATMSYEQHLDEVTTLITEKYDIADDVAIAMVMRAQADDFFTLHDDDPSICTLERAHEDARQVFSKYGKPARPATKHAGKSTGKR